MRQPPAKCENVFRQKSRGQHRSPQASPHRCSSSSRCRGRAWPRAARVRAKQTAEPARSKAWNEYVIPYAQADRRGHLERRLRRSRSPQWRSCHSAARLALRHPQLCRRRADARFGRLSGDRAVSARLRFHAIPVDRHATQWPAVRSRCRHHRSDGRAEDREGDDRRL